MPQEDPDRPVWHHGAHEDLSSRRDMVGRLSLVCTCRGNCSIHTLPASPWLPWPVAELRAPGLPYPPVFARVPLLPGEMHSGLGRL